MAPAEEGQEHRRAVRVLGTLESQLMDVLWDVTPTELSVQDVCTALGAGHNYKTVMTVLNRLVEKELLDRRLDGRAYRYRPHSSRREFLRSVANELVHGYMQAYGADAAPHLASALRTAAPDTPVSNAGASGAGASGAANPRASGPGDVGADGGPRRNSTPIAVIVTAIAGIEALIYLLARRKR